MQRVKLLQCQLHTLFPVRILSYYRCPKAPQWNLLSGHSSGPLKAIPTAPYSAHTIASLLQVPFLRTLSLLCTPEVEVPTFPRVARKSFPIREDWLLQSFLVRCFQVGGEMPLEENPPFPMVALSVKDTTKGHFLTFYPLTRLGVESWGLIFACPLLHWMCYVRETVRGRHMRIKRTDL